MTRRPDRRKFLTFAATVLTGCATRERGAGEGKYPPWLIRAADPVAPAIGFKISHVQWRDGYLKHKEDALRIVRPQRDLFWHTSLLNALELFYFTEVAKQEKALQRDRLVVESAP